MYRGLSSPPSESFPVKVKRDRKETPHGAQTHIHHNGLDKSTFLDPFSNEIAEAISPQILIHSNRHENRACNRLIAVNGVSTGDGW